MEKIDLLSLTLEELEQEMQAIGVARYRAGQIFSWLHEKQVLDFAGMTTLSQQFRTELSEKFCIKRLNIVRKLASSIDNTVKYLYQLPDGNFVETVLMEYHHGTSICISTQVGCRMGCRFCASAIAGFIRNLEPSELLLQIYETQLDAKRPIDSIVLMGIGEPLDNYDNVLRFFSLLSHPKGFGMSLRHVTVSTCGIVPKILELADQKLGVTLSVSLHSPENATRSEVMPVNRTWPIEVLMDACRTYVQKTGRRITFEYAVMDNVNSARSDAKKLADLLRGGNFHVNLIPVNPIRERNYKTLRKTVQLFQDTLTQYGVNATVRRTLGSDIQAAMKTASLHWCAMEWAENVPARRQADSPQKCFLSILKNPIRPIWILMPFVPCYCLLYQRRIRLFIQLQK